MEGISEGVSKCRGRALEGWCMVGLGLCTAGGQLQGQRIKPRSPTVFLVPKWSGKALAMLLSVPPPPPLQGLLHHCWTPNRGRVLLGVGTPPLRQPPFRGVGPLGPAFTFAPPSLPPTPSGPTWLEGALVGRGSGLRSQQAPGAQVGRGNAGHAPF